MKSDLNRTRRRQWSQQSPEDIWLEQGAYNSTIALFFREVEATGTNWTFTDADTVRGLPPVFPRYLCTAGLTVAILWGEDTAAVGDTGFLARFTEVLSSEAGI